MYVYTLTWWRFTFPNIYTGICHSSEAIWAQHNVAMPPRKSPFKTLEPQHVAHLLVSSSDAALLQKARDGLYIHYKSMDFKKGLDHTGLAEHYNLLKALVEACPTAVYGQVLHCNHNTNTNHDNTNTNNNSNNQNSNQHDSINIVIIIAILIRIPIIHTILIT